MTVGALASSGRPSSRSPSTRFAPPRVTQPARRESLIIGGGVALPTVVLAALLAYGLPVLPAVIAPAPDGAALVFTSPAKQWWWRVRYHDADGLDRDGERDPPAGRPARRAAAREPRRHPFVLGAVARRQDGHDSRAASRGSRSSRRGPATFRGACAEYCGASHALMAFVGRRRWSRTTFERGSTRRRGRRRRRPTRSRRGARPRSRERLRRLPHGARHRGRRTDRPGPDARRQPPAASAPATLPNDAEALVAVDRADRHDQARRAHAGVPRARRRTTCRRSPPISSGLQ